MTVLGPVDDWMLVDGARVEARFVERNDDGTLGPNRQAEDTGIELGPRRTTHRAKKKLRRRRGGFWRTIGSRCSMKFFVLIAALVAALSFAVAASADNPALTFSPNPVAVGDSLVLSGCGYAPGQTYQVQLVHNTKPATYIIQVEELADASGCLSTADLPYVLPASGKWTATVWLGIKHLVTVNFTVI